MSQLQLDIEHLKQALRYQQEIFSNQLYETGLFTQGTCERVMEERCAEQFKFFQKLNKIKRSIPKRLSKQIDEYLLALTTASRINVTIAAYASDDHFCDSMIIADDVREHFYHAKQESVKAYHDLVKNLFLQKTLSDHSDEMNCHISRVTNLHNYVTDVSSSSKRETVLKDICDIERKQRSDYYKKIAGITLRILGWGIIIAAAIIGFNPAVGFVIMGLSMIATAFGELLNLSGKKLAKPPVSQQQLLAVRDSLLFFKKKPSEVIVANGNSNAAVSNCNGNPAVSNDAEHGEKSSLLVHSA
jgi:hypothetical protein